MMRGMNLASASALIAGLVVAACATQPVVEVQPAEELFGTKLAGVHVETGLEWSECIEPDGDTVYQIAGTEMLGTLRLSDTGMACFTYDSDENCFAVERIDGGYSLHIPGDESSRFSVTDVQRGVEMCVAGELSA